MKHALEISSTLRHHLTNRPRRSLMAGLTASTLLATVAATALPASPAQAATTRHLKTFVAENENRTHVRTRAQALEDATNFDVISALPGTYRDHIVAMRQANPGLVVVAYMNGTFAQKSQGTSYPASWYARDKTGQKIQSRGFGNYLMRPNEPGWINDRVAACRALIQQSGYHGCMVDMLGVAPVQPGYTTSLPVNPATGALWTSPDWQRATAAATGKLQAAITTGEVWGNGYGSGSRYFTSSFGPSKLLNPSMVGGVAESWMRTASMPLDRYREEAEWKQSVDMLVDQGRAGTRGVVMVKLWAPGTVAQKDANHRYALSSFLLGSDGRASFNISYGHDVDALAPHPYWSRADIGAPSGPYTLTSGVYQRAFSQGKVVVNPTKVSRTISLGGSYVNLSGKTVSSLTLPPNSGDVLRKVG